MVMVIIDTVPALNSEFPLRFFVTNPLMSYGYEKPIGVAPD
jgi:hypothetical protein